jgi:hypothetical protein
VTSGLIARVATCALLVACTTATEPPGDLTGTWRAPFTIPGSAFSVDLTQQGRTISGTGAYSIEAGLSGTLQVAGSYTPPQIALQITYDYGAVWTFEGRVSDGHMAGVERNGGFSDSLNLIRQ